MITDDFKNLNFTIIGNDCNLHGEFHFLGDTIISSRLEGKLSIMDESKLILERKSIVEGEILCHDCEVYGDFRGKILSKGTVSIKSGATVKGTVDAKQLQVSPGSHVEIEGNTLE